MTRRSTIYEVAQRSGVSTATVSRVMHNASGYSTATGDRVRAIAAELGWLPNGSARSLAERRTGIVGLLFPDLDSGGDAEDQAPLYVDQVIRGAERAATDAGQAVLIAATRGASGHDLAVSIASKVDGLVVVAHSLSESEIAALGSRLPVVVLSDRSGRRTKLDSVGVDNRGGMRALVEHLLVDHGYRDLAFIAGPRRSPDSTERFAAFRQAMRAAAVPCPAEPHVVGNFTQAGGARAVDQLLADRQPPEAIVCGNDEMAIGALDVLTHRRLRVPGDVAITGFDDLSVARRMRPPLTTVAQPMREIGAEAVRAVLARLAEPAAERQATVLPTRLAIRRSCGCPPARRTKGTKPTELAPTGRTEAWH